MRKLLYLALGATLTVLTASPALAQAADVGTDMATAIQNRAAVDRDLAEAPHSQPNAYGTSGYDQADAVLGVAATVNLGFDGPAQVKNDMLAALRIGVQKDRDLATVPTGGSAD
jgi:hypothetical protein